ncbi:MAG TPA: GtrA family protein [Pseudonocardiaceae bacterium]|nr:GtrA family protein [Pseudonocardiaceae bacterium]
MGDTDSRVRLWSTIVGDVRGLARVALARVSGAVCVPDLPQRPVPRRAYPDKVLTERAGGGLLWQLAAFAVIGLISTAANAVLYVLLRSWAPPLVANLIALVAVNLLNTEANRRLTFASSRVSRQRAHLQGLVVFALYYVITSGGLLVLQAVVAHPSRWLEVTALLVSSVVGTLTRFLLLRAWVFTHDHSVSPVRAEQPR